ncbi:NAD(P)/FAD-dependent oxidoreductase [Staphylococcus arlettae]|uniref:NAD(P)/FAD-dependent oxidoreductase n=1 Tax=Staphylococcus arlettae TaxID=29378 RepID=UPI0021D34724|nr:NAD(P)/FAD-dependent oxidoreductase [Staphylococcus arlettae]UXU53827.1 NAD(P)-binding domain-containing protein [Staphylococcus arlettae]
MSKYTAIIIGAGPSGIGMSTTLKQFGIESLIIEKKHIGNTFEQWPDTTQFITPSFTTNGFGMPDINAITPDTSPAHTFKKEHIDGLEYQEYLKAVVDIHNLNIQTNTKVISIKKNGGIFEIITDQNILKADYVFVATGDFAFPHKPFSVGKHYSEIKNFNEFKGNHITILGANESGIDAAINLTKLGKKVTIISKTSTYNNDKADPSITLSPYTNQRFKELLQASSPIRLLTNRNVTSIKEYNEGCQIFCNNQDEPFLTDEIVQATGFAPKNNPLIQALFEISEDNIILSTQDESTVFNNAFLIGSVIQNEDAILCYIYKFRARFAVLANLICERENITVSSDLIEYYKQNQMFLEDYSCCDVKCSC